MKNFISELSNENIDLGGKPHPAFNGFPHEEPHINKLWSLGFIAIAVIISIGIFIASQDIVTKLMVKTNPEIGTEIVNNGNPARPSIPASIYDQNKTEDATTDEIITVIDSMTEEDDLNVESDFDDTPLVEME